MSVTYVNQEDKARPRLALHIFMYNMEGVELANMEISKTRGSKMHVRRSLIRQDLLEGEPKHLRLFLMIKMWKMFY